MYSEATTTYVDRMTNAHENAARLAKAIKVADVIWAVFVQSGDHSAEWLMTSLPTIVKDDSFWDQAAASAGVRKLSYATRLVVNQLIMTRAHAEISRHPLTDTSTHSEILPFRPADAVEVRRLHDGAVQVMSMGLVDERASQALSWKDKRGRHVVPAVTIVHSDGAQYQYRRAQ